MIRSKGIPPAYREPVPVFQSLFSWMIRSKGTLVGFSSAELEFQSLFSWMIRSKMMRETLSAEATTVSILVLLDDSLEVLVGYITA